MKRLAAAAAISSALFAQSFEVASVKPDRSDSGHTSVDTDGNLLRMTNITLQAAIVWAYRISAPQISGPAWLALEKYDILAKTESGEPSPPMLQALLAERFHLEVHRETKELPVYALIVAKNGPKLKKASLAKDDLRSSLGHLTATGISMPRLAEFLARPRAGLDRPVADQTGIDGVFDFTLDWTPDDSTKKSADAPPSIFVALQEQLGLKLEARKSPMPVLIVDRAEKTPVEN
jgi:uncharacterized protein (TIGR03435 family)